MTMVLVCPLRSATYFRYFYRICRKCTQRKGFGLGLSYVKGMVEHMGRISVRSEEGQFSEFKLIFPLKKDME